MLLFELRLALADQTFGESSCNLNLHNFFFNFLVKKKITNPCAAPELPQPEEGAAKRLKTDNYPSQINLPLLQLKEFNGFYFYKNNIFTIKNFLANNSKTPISLKPTKPQKKLSLPAPSPVQRASTPLYSLPPHKTLCRIPLKSNSRARRGFAALRYALPRAFNYSINFFIAILHQHAATALYTNLRASRRHFKKKLILDLFTPSARDFRNDAILRATRASLNFNLSTLRILPNVPIIDCGYLRGVSPRHLVFLKMTTALAPGFALSTATRFAQVQNFFENTYNIYAPFCARLTRALPPQNAQNDVVVKIDALRNKKPEAVSSEDFSFTYAVNAFYRNFFSPTLPPGGPFALSNSTHFDKPFLLKHFDIKMPNHSLRQTRPANLSPLSPLFWAASRPELIALFAKKPFLIKFVYAHFALKTAFHGDALYGAYFKFFEKTFPFGRPNNLNLNNIFFEKNFLFFIKKNTIKSFAFFKLPLLAFS
jgi:hypothetical protein